jgi:hypothetical protein
LLGSGSITTADLSAIGNLGANLTGEGTVTAELVGIGHISASISSAGELLSTANVGDAVWGALLEAGFTASQIMRITAAAVAGKSTGGPDNPTFRNLSDTQNQIVGTATADGDRTVTSYGD